MNVCWSASRGRAWREVPRTLRLGAALVEALWLYPKSGWGPGPLAPSPQVTDAGEGGAHLSWAPPGHVTRGWWAV